MKGMWNFKLFLQPFWKISDIKFKFLKIKKWKCVKKLWDQISSMNLKTILKGVPNYFECYAWHLPLKILFNETGLFCTHKMSHLLHYQSHFIKILHLNPYRMFLTIHFTRCHLTRKNLSDSHSSQGHKQQNRNWKQVSAPASGLLPHWATLPRKSSKVHPRPTTLKSRESMIDSISINYCTARFINISLSS